MVFGLETLPGLNARWGQALGGPMDLGIGLNTGMAQVGNTESEFKFKYGPLGDAVNVASRVQGLTKYLKRRLLMTADTQRKLGPGFISRRVVKTRLVNMDRAFDLFEVARSVGALVHEHPGDGPLLLVLARAAHMLVQARTWDPVWTPPGK